MNIQIQKQAVYIVKSKSKLTIKDAERIEEMVGALECTEPFSYPTKDGKGLIVVVSDDDTVGEDFKKIIKGRIHSLELVLEGWEKEDIEEE
ncbi:MAG: hypothetical protein HXS54_01250 [Theionarchaea archaeon]|nr:hypothetical protein [Theionarchaea archaeon]